MAKLSEEQRKVIRQNFEEFMTSKAFKKDLESRRNHVESLAALLEEEKIKNFDEIDFGKLISNLWASNAWGNKDYLVKHLLDENGLDKLKEKLLHLLYGQDPIEKRFDDFRREIKGLGPSSVTEILCISDPTKYGIWNDKAKKGLLKIGIDSLPLRKYSISGKEYVEINETFLEIAQELKKTGYKNVELLVVDYFLYELATKEEMKRKVKITNDFNHNEIVEFIKEIGDLLGFETETNKKVSTGAVVDVVWRARIANLGAVTYVFEVQKSGSIDSLVLNLQKAQNNPTVQKIIAVSDVNQIEHIKKEVGSLSENFRKALTFWDYEDIIKTHGNLSEAIESINKLELVKSQFQEKLDEEA